MLTNLFGSSRQRLSHNADAVVTGAGSGIGRAFAIELAKRGGRIVCVDINAARAAETADAIGSAAEPFTCDVANRSDMESLALHAELSFGGPPTLVINNAGVGIGGRRIGSIGLDDWEWALGINLMGVVYGCELFVPQLRAAG
ncbi:MAG: SDR family NAD(P)-dependent oxidoreductase, partial [Nocardiaceae bacterium]|nr:SDR family NAD(P)-dependent oxidoreductase [Nocardiaceae bacterium]